MTWKELKDKISLMTEEEQQQEVAVWGEYLNLMKDCSLEKTNESLWFLRVNCFLWMMNMLERLN